MSNPQLAQHALFLLGILLIFEDVPGHDLEDDDQHDQTQDG